ncbi:LysR family transcriptional regulator [Zymobacter palmae]|uniref:Transcriptional regulator n=1 Tax=Zymobacter palmae TaxID=33074 RepID=A0A348HF26_9GAMM|nr:LysR family transcriptional regulator [Zymobacter palmae]BBG30228.1 transcriptional regulator [Zymobacter palmae]
MNLETKWLDDFVALADAHSFSAAARQRHVTQPAFSRRIRMLEQTIGRTLVDRSTSPVRLTPVGERFLQTARALVEQLDDCLPRLQAPDEGTLLSLRIAAAHSLASTFYPGWLCQPDNPLQQHHVEINAMNVAEVGMSVMLHRHDLGLIYHPANMPMDEQMQTRFDLHRLGGTRLLPVQRSAGAEHRWLGYAQGTLLGHMTSLLPVTEMQHDDQERQPTHCAESANVLKAMIMQGIGAGWLPELLIDDELEAGTLVTLGDEQVLLDIILIRAHETHPEPLRDALWHALPDSCADELW